MTAKGGIQNDCSGNNPWNGGADFTGMDNATAYWAHVDHVLQRSAAYGITVLAGTAFHGSFDNCSIPYFASMEKTPDATLTAYGAFLGNRYKSYPNIIWLHGGDANASLCGSDVTKKEDAIARGIMSADPIHLMAVEATNNQWGEASATNWSSSTFGTRHSPRLANAWDHLSERPASQSFLSRKSRKSSLKTQPRRGRLLSCRTSVSRTLTNMNRTRPLILTSSFGNRGIRKF